MRGDSGASTVKGSAGTARRGSGWVTAGAVTTAAVMFRAAAADAATSAWASPSRKGGVGPQAAVSSSLRPSGAQRSLFFQKTQKTETTANSH